MREIQGSVAKARESLDAARMVHAGRHFDAAASRAYYCAFYMAEAALATLGLSFSSHKAVISTFGVQFIKTGIFVKPVHATLNWLYLLRLQADYGGIYSVTEQESADALDNADFVVTTIVNYLEDSRREAGGQS